MGDCRWHRRRTQVDGDVHVPVPVSVQPTDERTGRAKLSCRLIPSRTVAADGDLGAQLVSRPHDTSLSFFAQTEWPALRGSASASRVVAIQEIHHRPSTNNSPMTKSVPKIVLLRRANQSGR